MISDKIARKKRTGWKKTKNLQNKDPVHPSAQGAYRTTHVFRFFWGESGKQPWPFSDWDPGAQYVYFATVGLFGLPVWNFQHNLLRRMCSIATSVVPVFCCYWEWLWLWLLLLSSRLSSLLSSLSSLAAGRCSYFQIANCPTWSVGRLGFAMVLRCPYLQHHKVNKCSQNIPDMPIGWTCKFGKCAMKSTSVIWQCIVQSVSHVSCNGQLPC